MHRALSLALLCAIALFETCTAIIYWQDCVGVADHPPTKRGNFHNLCVRQHKFVRLTFPWLITKTSMTNVDFNNCVFLNNRIGVTNFTGSTFTNVRFNDCEFKSFTKNPMRLNNMVFTNVEFNKVLFDKSAELKFKEFSMTNVTFKNCRFQSDTLFREGQLQDVTFHGCSFRRSLAPTVNGNDAIRFDRVTMRKSGFFKSKFITPIVFQWVNGADLFFNHTTFGQFWCHDRPVGGRKPKHFSSFNNSLFQDAVFSDSVSCDRTSWRGFGMYNGTFQSNADFSGSEIQDLYWDTVAMTESFKGQCNTLDFSNSKLFRKRFARVTVLCQADFRNAKIQIVKIESFNAKKFNFKGVIFTDQEYVDGNCCMTLCKTRQCRCNITSPSNTCPDAGYPVNYNAPWFCFPADARVATLQGSVRMDELEHGHRVAVGSGLHSDVFFFGHRSRGHHAKFIEIAHTGPASPLRISGEHYLYSNGHLTTAKNVRVGDTLQSGEGTPLAVISVSHTMRRGLYAPASLHGDLIVDGVTVSSYTNVVHPRLAHFLLHPLRMLYRAGLGSVVKQFNMFEKKSWEHIPRSLGIPQGPETVEL